MEIFIAPSVIFSIYGVSITNTMLAVCGMTLAIIIFSFGIRRGFGLVPTRLQLVFEFAASFVLDQLALAFQSKEKARMFFPLFMTLLVFILLANQLTILPLIGQLVYEDKALFRTPTSDISLTLALGLVTVLSAHIMALGLSPIRHLGNFVKIGPLLKSRSMADVGNALLEVFLGFLDLIGEFAKVMSLSFRLFGNILAGELIILIIGGLAVFTSVLVPVPFIVLSIFSGLVQAVVFTMLSIQFVGGTLNAVYRPEDDRATESVQDGYSPPSELQPVHSSQIN